MENNLTSLTSSNTDKELRDTYLAVCRQAPNYVENAQVNVPSGTDPRFALVSKAEGYFMNNDGAPEEITWTDKVVTMRGAYNANGNVTMSYDGTYDPTGEHVTSPYPSAFTFTPVSGTNCFKLSYKDHNDVTRYLCRGTEAGSTDAWSDSQIRTTTDAANALIFRVIPQTTADGIWYLKNTHVGDEDKTSALVNLVGNERNNSFYTANENYAIKIVDGTLSIPVTVKEGYTFSTTILPYSVDLPEAIDAYTIDGISDGTDKAENKINGVVQPEGTVMITKVVSKTLEACKPYLIHAKDKAEEADAVTETYNKYGVAYTGQDGVYGYYSNFEDATHYGATATANNEIFLVGAVEDNMHVMPPSDASYITYVLSKKPVGHEAFYHYSTNRGVKLPANKTYLRVSKGDGSSSVKSELLFSNRFWDLEDTIDETTGEPVRIVGIYNTRGMKIPDLQKGLNIIKMSDGSTQKVMVK